jgi:hypothetical protein
MITGQLLRRRYLILSLIFSSDWIQVISFWEEYHRNDVVGFLLLAVGRNMTSICSDTEDLN